jgi:hypothetical protein
VDGNAWLGFADRNLLPRAGGAWLETDRAPTLCITSKSKNYLEAWSHVLWETGFPRGNSATRVYTSSMEHKRNMHWKTTAEGAQYFCDACSWQTVFRSERIADARVLFDQHICAVNTLGVTDSAEQYVLHEFNCSCRTPLRVHAQHVLGGVFQSHYSVACPRCRQEHSIITKPLRLFHLDRDKWVASPLP